MRRQIKQKAGASDPTTYHTEYPVFEYHKRIAPYLLDSGMEPLDELRWLDLFLQHAVSENMARSYIRDVADDAQLIAKINETVPGEGAEKVVQVLSFPGKYKRPWLSMFLRYKLPAEHARAFVGGITRGLPELEAKLRRLIPGERGETLIKEVRASVLCVLRIFICCV